MHVDHLRGLLCISRRDKVPNARIRQLCGVTKGVDERIDGVLLLIGWPCGENVNDKIARRVYVGECAGIHSMGSPRRRWIDTVKDCLKERALDVRQARRWCLIGVYGRGL